MKHPLSLENLVRFLRSENINISGEQRQQLAAYYSMLLSWGQRQNLYAGGERSDLIGRHFVPSLHFYALLRFIKPACIADIGSGAGFPGIILQIMLPEISLTLIDSSRKKCLFLREVCDSLNLNSRIVQNRIENIAPEYESAFDCIVARFLGNFATLWFTAKPLLRPSGLLLVQKGVGENFNVPHGAQHIKYRHAGDSWIEVSPALSSKYIIEVKKQNG